VAKESGSLETADRLIKFITQRFYLLSQIPAETICAPAYAHPDFAHECRKRIADAPIHRFAGKRHRRLFVRSTSRVIQHSRIGRESFE
jgi:hypothetical protein